MKQINLKYIQPKSELFLVVLVKALYLFLTIVVRTVQVMLFYVGFILNLKYKIQVYE